MSRCLCCKHKTNKVYLMQCTYCKNEYCINCRLMETHKCEHLIDCKTNERNKLEKTLESNTAIANKVIKI